MSESAFLAARWPLLWLIVPNCIIDEIQCLPLILTLIISEILATICMITINRRRLKPARFQRPRKQWRKILFIQIFWCLGVRVLVLKIRWIWCLIWLLCTCLHIFKIPLKILHINDEGVFAWIHLFSVEMEAVVDHFHKAQILQSLHMIFLWFVLDFFFVNFDLLLHNLLRRPTTLIQSILIFFEYIFFVLV